MAEIIEFQPRVREGQRRNKGKGATVLPWSRPKADVQPPVDKNAGLARLIDPPLKGAEE